MSKAEEKSKQGRREILSLSQENTESLYILKSETLVLRKIWKPDWVERSRLLASKKGRAENRQPFPEFRNKKEIRYRHIVCR